jgi:hypothetical protein
VTWRDTGDVALLVVYLIPAWGAPIDYALTAGWWRSRLGWHLMSYMVVVAWFAALGLYRVLAGVDAPGLDAMRAVGYVGAGIILYWRWWVVHQWRRQGTLGPTAADVAADDRKGSRDAGTDS